MTAPPKRRWFRFSLRTMFVAVTVLCLCLGLGWQLKIVRERKAIIAEIGEAFIRIQRRDCRTRPLEDWSDDEKSSGYAYARRPRIMLLLGDRSYVRIFLPEKLDSSLLIRAEFAFPESELHLLAPGQGWKALAFRDSLYKPLADRQPNRGTIFKTGLIEK